MRRPVDVPQADDAERAAVMHPAASGSTPAPSLQDWTAAEAAAVAAAEAVAAQAAAEVALEAAATAQAAVDVAREAAARAARRAMEVAADAAEVAAAAATVQQGRPGPVPAACGDTRVSNAQACSTDRSPVLWRADTAAAQKAEAQRVAGYVVLVAEAAAAAAVDAALVVASQLDRDVAALADRVALNDVRAAGFPTRPGWAPVTSFAVTPVLNPGSDADTASPGPGFRGPTRPAAVPATVPPLMSPMSATSIGHVLGDLRRRLRMDVALVSHFEDGRRVIDIVDTDESVPFGPGDSDPVAETYCQPIVDGVLPAMILDTSENVLAMAIAATSELDIRAHLGVPVVLEDGTVYGTLCAYSHDVRLDLTAQAGTIMGLVADTVARAIGVDQAVERSRKAAAERVSNLLTHARLDMAYQPLVEAATGRTVGVEALARFPTDLGGTTASWFEEAAAVGAGTELELACVRLVRDHLADLPAELDVHVNLSPQALLDPAVSALLHELPLRRIVLELTEHQIVGDYPLLSAVLAPLRAAGMRLAIDDAGAGFASMRHVLLLEPDLLKLDISLVRGIDTDAAKRSLCQALTGFAHATGAAVIAEGVETQAEADAIRALGVDLAQGYFFARPQPRHALHATAVERASCVAPPNHATQIQAVVASLRTHSSPATISAALNRQGLLAPTGRRWHATSVSRQLLD